jgi:hypothetical protein
MELPAFLTLHPHNSIRLDAMRKRFEELKRRRGLPG